MSHGRVCGVTMSQCHIGGCVVSDVKEWHPALMSDGARGSPCDVNSHKVKGDIMNTT